MPLRRILIILRYRLLLLVVLVIVGLAAAYLGTSRTANYRAQATVLMGSTPTTINPTLEFGQALLATTLAEVVPTPTVVGKAVAATKAPRTVGGVVAATKASVIPGSNLIKITVTDRDPVVAQTLTNGIADVFVSGAQLLAPVTTTPGEPKVTPARVAEPATLPSSPVATNLDRNVALGGLAGLLIAVAVILLLDFLGLSARTPRELEAELDLPVLGIVPFQPRIARARGGPDGDGELLLMYEGV
ncbi:MAG: hypothetical protein M3Y36_01355 [Actinomycetota bacterium]|nr:hypothetical protein [Actinomycetota bacterium]